MEGALDPVQLAYVAGWALALAAIAWALYRKLAPRVGEVV
jgi:ABC-type polysaccharide/polyol phosphate export permease